MSEFNGFEQDGDPVDADPVDADPVDADPVDADPVDADVVGELRELAARIDPVPAELLTAADAGFILRTLDAELARLTYDSAVDAGSLVAVRSVGTVRMLSFEAPGITVEVEAVEVDGRRRLVGQVVPARPGVVEVRFPGGVVTTTADEMGRFVAAGIEPGPVSLRCSVGPSSDPVLVDTDWFLA